MTGPLSNNLGMYAGHLKILTAEVKQTLHKKLYLQDSLDGMTEGVFLSILNGRSRLYLHLPESICMGRNGELRLGIHLWRRDMSIPKLRIK